MAVTPASRPVRKNLPQAPFYRGRLLLLLQLLFQNVVSLLLLYLPAQIKFS